ncbi:MAG: ribonuclease P protein component [Flavobacteriaceae bacterium]|nr:ribonuclease P protein component [Flavobacteriaceae bacterium]
MSFAFNKQERLTSLKIIGQLFGRKAAFSFSAYPILLAVLPIPLPTPSPVQVVVSVPKRNFKNAPDRNRLKRLLREAWRLNKHLYYETLTTQNTQAAILLLWTGKAEVPFEEVQKQIVYLHTKFAKQKFTPTTHAETSAE